MTGTQRSAQAVLRSYQRDVIQATRGAIAGGSRRPLLVAPTGSGKTIMASAVIERAVARGSRVLFLAHRRELITQAVDKLWRSAGIDAAILMAGYPTRPECPVQVGSIQTVHARAVRTSAMDLPPADLVIVDEAHRARARQYEELIERYPGAVVLGLTATPCRGDGKGLGNVFDDLVECPDVGELIELGYLVRPTVYAPSAPDLSGVKTERGDYVESQLAERVNTAELVGDIVEHWFRLARDRKTVVFATGVAHSVHVRDEFRRAGVVAEHIDGSTPNDERDRIIADLSAGRVQLVTNCNVLTEGWDSPEVSACILARPTKHMGLYRQMVGRVLRTSPGKTDALILDHAGCTNEHGFVDDPVEWTLDTDKRARNKRQEARKRAERPGLADCPECGAVRNAGDPCGACGWAPRRRAEAPEIADGELERVDKNGTRTTPQHNPRAWYGGLLYIARERGYKDGWAFHKYKEKFGKKPPRGQVAPQYPDPAIRAWVRSRQIAYAKAKQRANA